MSTQSQKNQAAGAGAISGAAAGAYFGPWGAAIGAVGGGLLGYINANNRPTYKVNTGYDENRALASQEAFGVNPSIQQGLDQADQDQAETLNQAQQYSSSASSIMNTLSSLSGRRMSTQRQLRGIQGQFNQQGRRELAMSNKDLAEERDKEWNYNVNEPYQYNVQTENNAIQSSSANGAKQKDLMQAMKLLGYGKTDSMVGISD